ncbi:MAG TPA: bifunctional folylpolyglutamate synthase/dihydrofolate synthase [Nitrospirae bacterium]|nr:bifunctional folylpolyglutamate synthase/dihydrofolate synthase [Nitrospirota bacterium]
MKLGLANTLEIMKILGEPQKSFQSIHIAGTNGKGSTATALSSILKECGFNVGLFTSPHLISFTERIRLNNIQISEQSVIALAEEIRGLIDGTGLQPTFFEFVTAMAFHYFASENVDFGIIETGMGGRFDSTNVIAPDISIITNIGLDHCDFLGSSISDIAFEKAGIIKPKVPVITTSKDPDVVKQLSDIAAERGSGIHVYDRDFSGSLLSINDRHIEFNYTGHKSYSNLSFPLSGRYQLFNACAAIRASELLMQKGLSIPDRAISEGLSKVKLEGRFEYVSENPPIILDGAHNPEAISSLSASLGDLLPGKKIILVLGVMNDKDISGIIEPIIHNANSIILTKAAYERSASTQRLAETINSLYGPGIKGTAEISSTENVTEAINLARSRCDKNSVILITGSFYTTGEAKELLGHTGVLSRLREKNEK